MRIALISDIHGNAIALQTTLEDIQKQNVDRIICLGDVAATGPQPHESLVLLKSLNCPVIQGNTDARLLEPPSEPRENLSEFMQQIEDIDDWCAEQLDDADRDFLKAFVPTYQIQFDANVDLLCFHGSPNYHSDFINALTPEEDLDKLYSGFHATIMAGGHTHEQMFRRYKDMILLNPGSVGLSYQYPYDDGEPYNAGWAEYAIVAYEKGNLTVEMKRVALDIDRMVALLRESDMPHKDLFIDDLLIGKK